MDWMLMPLKRYADFSGRSRRMEYWMWVLFQFLIGLAYWVLVAAFAGAGVMTGDISGLFAAGGAVLLITLLYFLLGLVFFIPNLAVTVRRLHDTNRSGWWILAPMVPYLVIIFVTMGTLASAGPKPDQTTLGAMGIVILVAGLAMLVVGIILLVFLLLEGTRGPNRFGPDPKSPTPEGVFS